MEKFTIDDLRRQLTVELGLKSAAEALGSNAGNDKAIEDLSIRIEVYAQELGLVEVGDVDNKE